MDSGDPRKLEPVVHVRQPFFANCGRYGPIYRPTRYAFSTAFLATEGFLDTDSLAARMIQARFTGYFRFGCKCFSEFMSDPSFAAAGTEAPEESRKNNPPDFTGRYDRDILLMATILFAQSYDKETGGGVYHIDPLQLWRETCEFPNGFRNAVPTSMWQRDPDIYGDADMFGHEVEPIDIAPIRAIGPLRLLRGETDVKEDFTSLVAFPSLRASLDHQAYFEVAMQHRSLFSIDKFVKHRVCDPEHRLTIEEAIGNPPEFEVDIRDSSHIRLRESDMRVPAEARGESAFESTKLASKQCPDGGGCDLTTPFAWRDSSFLVKVYVTSSDDPEVLPGLHRLLDLKAFKSTKCADRKEQRCGVKRELVRHGRKKPSCSFFCHLANGAKAVGTSMVSVSTSAMSVFPNPISNTLGGISDDVVSWLNPMPPPGSSTDVVQPYSSIGRAALYGVAPNIFGIQSAGVRGTVGGPSLKWAKDKAGSFLKSSTFGPFGRRLVSLNYKTVQVDWTYDAVYTSTVINDDEEENAGYITGRDFLLQTRCLTLDNLPAGAIRCGTGETAAYRDLKNCYQGELELTSQPSSYGRYHFLERLGVPPPPPRPPPRHPPPSPPPPPSPKNPPTPPAGFDWREMQSKASDVQACAVLDSNPYFQTLTSVVCSSEPRVIRCTLSLPGPVASTSRYR